MAVFRVERNKGYTVMSNHHLRNKELTLKAKGLLSQMLSLPEDWDYTLAGLSQINREKIDAIREAIKELERAGYIVRSRERDEKGRLRGADYVIYEQPHTEPTPDLPTLENPTLDNPMQEKPMLEKPTLENPMQLNKDIQRTDLPTKEKTNTDLQSTHRWCQLLKNSVLRFCAGLLAAVLLSMAVIPCYAVSDKYTSTGTFWQAVADKWYFNGTFIPAVIGTVSDKVYSESGDKKHHGSLKSYEQNSDKSYTAICDFCSAEFLVYDADLSAAYDNYVETLPAPGYNSSGGLIWQPTLNDFDFGESFLGFAVVSNPVRLGASAEGGGVKTGAGENPAGAEAACGPAEETGEAGPGDRKHPAEPGLSAEEIGKAVTQFW